jgi:DNA-binding transcriptional regulator YbjK
MVTVKKHYKHSGKDESMGIGEGTAEPRPGATPRQRALDAALRVLGEHGLRALTHARVDAAAELPKGSTSNYFRTRQALLEGMVEHLARQERMDFGGPAPVQLDREQAIAAFTAMLEAQAGPFRHRTLARYALFIDAAHDDELLAPLLANRLVFERWTTTILALLGAPDPVDSTAFLMAALDGLLLHRLTVDARSSVEPHVTRALDACLHG